MDLNVSSVDSNAAAGNIKDRKNYFIFGSIKIDTSIFDFSSTGSYQTGNNTYKISLKDGTVITTEKQLEEAYITALEDGTIEFYGFSSKNDNPTNVTGTKKENKYSFVNCSNFKVDSGNGDDSINATNSKNFKINSGNGNDTVNITNSKSISVNTGEGSDSVNVAGSKSVMITSKDEDKTKDINTISYDDNSECYIISDEMIESHNENITKLTFY